MRNNIHRVSNILWPMFLVGALVELFVQPRWDFFSSNLAVFLAATLGLNSVHVALTPGILRLPEYEGIKRKFWSNLDRRGHALCGLTLITMLAFSIWIWQSSKLAQATYQSLLVFHALMQTKGALLLFIPAAVVGGRRYISRLFVVLTAFNICFTILYEMNADSISAETRLVLFLLQMLPIAAIVFKYRRVPASEQREYLFFTGRLLLWPLSVFSFVAFLGILSLHGYEYLSIFNKMLTASRATPARKKSLQRATLLGMIVLCVLSLGVISWTSEKPLLFRFLFSALVFVTLCHILLDSVIFRFRNRDVASEIGPLLGVGR